MTTIESTQTVGIVIVEKIGSLKSLTVKDYKEDELYKKCGLIHEIDEFLLEYNFKRVITNMTIHGWGDALYVLDN